MKQKELEEKMNEYGVYSDKLEKEDKHIIADLTMRITDKLHQELTNNQQKVAKDNQVGSLISKEIEQNTCGICYELMVPPTYSPILLFPCGHTFCKHCVYTSNKHHPNHRQLTISKCPMCRQAVESAALNISL